MTVSVLSVIVTTVSSRQRETIVVDL